MVTVVDKVSLTTAMVGGVALLLTFYLLIKKKRHNNLPPGPAGLPLYGNILDIQKSDKHGPGILDKWAEQFGDVYYIRMGQYPTIVLNSLAAIKEALVKHGDKTSGRSTNVFLLKLISVTDVGIVLNDGPLWKDLRRASLHSLRDFGMGKKSLEQRIQEEARALIQYLGDLEDKAFNPRVILHNAFTNVIVSIIFGERYEYDDPEFKYLSDLLLAFITNGGIQNPEMFVPVLTPLIPLCNRHLFSAIIANKKLEAFLKDTIKNHTDQFDPKVIQNFIDIYLKEKEDGHFKDANAEKQLFFSILDLFLAGSETSTTTTRWALLYLIHYPEVQAKCQKLIHKVLGQEKIPNNADRKRLVYVEATIYEIQRLANIAPYAVLHRVTETMELCGYTIPQDTLIIPNLYHLHNDPRYWINPECFNPDRWIDSNGELIKHDAFMPFSVGPRECLGKTLAIQELFIFLVSLLQKFTVTAKDPDNPPKLSGSIGLVYLPDDFEIKLHKV